MCGCNGGMPSFIESDANVTYEEIYGGAPDTMDLTEAHEEDDELWGEL